MAKWALLHIHEWIDIGSNNEDVVTDGPVVAYGQTYDGGQYHVDGRDILRGTVSSELSYVDESDGDRFDIINPEEWPDSVCAELAKRTLVGEVEDDEDD